MADRDEALHYLLNKLKSEDGWSGSNLAWNVDKLSVIADMFRALDGVAKVKVLLSFTSMTPRTISQCSKEMNQVLRLARRDGEEWVRLFASVLSPFPDSQSINTDLINEQMDGLPDEIEGSLTQDSPNLFIPHEYAYLNHTVLAGSHGYQPQSGHTHFVLKKKPQASVQLRNEILQRAGTDFSQTGSLVKDRHLLQRQLSSSLTSSNTFVPTVRSHSSRKAVPIPGMANRVQRERGTKLLDIDEVPLTTRRKRKTAATEEGVPAGGRPETKKHPRTPSKSEPDTPTPVTPQLPPPQFTATPDYAAGLGSEFSTPSMYGQQASRKYSASSGDEALLSPTYKGQRSDMAEGQRSTPSTPLLTPSIDKLAELPLFQPSPAPIQEAPPTPGPSASQLPPPQAAAPSPAVAKQPNKGLKLSRHQLVVAQEMFKESPTLTKEQKTLILGFMAGSRENPNPDQPIVTIKLSEKQVTEEVPAPLLVGGVAKRNVLYETVFEMNYTNGQWRKLQIKRAFPAFST